MLSERLQILISAEQRKRWEAEAARRGTSVAGLIREAVDRDLGVLEGERGEAVDAIRAMTGRFLPPGELDRLIEEERARAGQP
ncbi:MAG: antitoxin [Actinobacteria bacterium]|nr:antitoxin [Actinomycetota bacterium]